MVPKCYWKRKNAVPFPSPVRDGEIDEEVLNSLNITKEWLINELSKYGHKDYQKIFLCLVEDNGLFIVPKRCLKTSLKPNETITTTEIEVQYLLKYSHRWDK